MLPDADGTPPARLISWPEAMLIAGLVVVSLFLLAAGAYLLRYGTPATSRHGVVRFRVTLPPGSYVLQARSSQERLSAQGRHIEVLGGQALNRILSLSGPLRAASAGQLAP